MRTLLDRKQRLEAPPNHERWLVSYADFITLLFAFFVVMYSVSAVNQDKYRIFSESMVSAFKLPRSALDFIQLGQQSQSSFPVHDYAGDESREAALALSPLRAEYRDRDLAKTPAPEVKEERFSNKLLDIAEAEISEIADAVELNMAPLVDTGIIDVKRNKFWLEVEIKSSLLFASGSSVLIAESVPVLMDLSSTFAPLPNRIHIEGFTDAEPINTPEYPSNWELSAARAAAVVRLFENNGVDPARLAAIGYSEYHPVSANDSEESRAKNRRVVLVVMADMKGHESERIYELEMLRAAPTAAL